MNIEEIQKGVAPYSLRNFVRRLSNASVRKRWRESQLEEIGSRMRELSGGYVEESSLRIKMSEKDMRVMKIAEAERTIEKRQITEQREIDQLRENVRVLEERLEALSHIHSFVTDTHAQRIAELQETLKKAKTGKGLDSMGKEEVHKFVLEKMKPKEEERRQKREKAKAIRSLQKSIDDAEKMYAKLKKKGYLKEDLDRLRVRIDLYKERLDKLK